MACKRSPRRRFPFPPQVISIQMHGSVFFDHLLSLGEVRKQLDDAYAKLRESVQGELETLFSPNRFRKSKEEEAGARSSRKGPGDEIWDPAERQLTVKGDRVIAERGDPRYNKANDFTAKVAATGREEDEDEEARRRRLFKLKEAIELHSVFLKNLDRQLNASTPQACGVPILERLDSVVRDCKLGVTVKDFKAAVLEDMLGPGGELDKDELDGL